MIIGIAIYKREWLYKLNLIIELTWVPCVTAKIQLAHDILKRLGLWVPVMVNTIVGGTLTPCWILQGGKAIHIWQVLFYSVERHSFTGPIEILYFHILASIPVRFIPPHLCLTIQDDTSNLCHLFVIDPNLPSIRAFVGEAPFFCSSPVFQRSQKLWFGALSIG